MIKFFDTSALLNGNYPEKDDYISSTVLRELENIKVAGERKSQEVKHSARKTVRYFLNNPPKIYVLSEKDWKEIQSYYSFSECGDNRIMAELLMLQKEYGKDNIILWTSDICFYLLAKQLNILAHYCMNNEMKGGIYKGYRELELCDEQFEQLYSSPEKNVCELLQNEYCILKKNGEVVDIIRWNGEKNEPITVKPINNKFMDTVYPKDVYQKIGFDLLVRKEVPVKLIQGHPGSGKDFVMTASALDKVMRREKEKIIFIRNLIELKDAPQIGFLAGSLEEKIAWGAGPIYDIVGGEEGYEWLKNEGIIEQVNLGFIRGHSFGPNYILYITEAQNLTESAMQSIISRAGEGTEIYINADLKQIDKTIFEQNNGVMSLQQNLKGNSLFGATFFPYSHRSAVAELSGLLTSY